MKKTDNDNLKSKLDLRRYFLEKYHREGVLSVCDCCMGSGVLWSKLKREFKVKDYIGMDVKPKKGRLKIDSARYLQAGGYGHDVIDVDTYGSPWKHYVEILKHINSDVTLFLTIGATKIGGGCILSNIVKKRIGLDKIKNLPMVFMAKLEKIQVESMIPICLDYSFEIVECLESERGKNARYVGIRLRKTCKS